MTPTERVMHEIAREIVENTRAQNAKGEFILSRDQAEEVTVYGFRAVAGYPCREGRIFL